MSNEVTTTQEPTVMGMLERAVNDPNFDADKLEKLIELKERVDAVEAKKAFIKSMTEFHQNPPRVIKTKQGNNSKYADLGDSIKVIRPALLAVGITPSWKTRGFKDDGRDKTEVTCTLSHILGHETHSSLAGVAEDSGSKNAIQGVGSTVSYFKRYTLEAACGLVSEDEDTDGRAPEKPTVYITAAEVAHLEKMMEDNGVTIEQFQQASKLKSVSDVHAADYARTETFIKARGIKNADNS